MNAKRGIFTLTMVLGLLGFLTACADNAQPETPVLLPVQATPVDPDPVGWRLAQAAEKASSAMHKMAQVEAFRTPMPAQNLEPNTPELQQVTSITWNGPIDQITRTLAEMAGYKFRIVGKAPPLPFVVVIDAHQQPIGRILQDIGSQAGRRADVIVDSNLHTLDLRYAPTDGLTYN